MTTTVSFRPVPAGTRQVSLSSSADWAAGAPVTSITTRNSLSPSFSDLTA